MKHYSILLYHITQDGLSMVSYTLFFFVVHLLRPMHCICICIQPPAFFFIFWSSYFYLCLIHSSPMQGLFHRERAIITMASSFPGTIPLSVSAASYRCTGYYLVVASSIFRHASSSLERTCHRAMRYNPSSTRTHVSSWSLIFLVIVRCVYLSLFRKKLLWNKNF